MTDEETPPAPVESVAPEAPQEAAPEVQATEPSAPTEQFHGIVEPVSEPVPAPASESMPAAAEPPVSPAATPVAATVVPSPNIVQELLIKARAKIQDKKRKKLDRIAEQVNTDGKITNTEVQKMLRVSKPTATRYLSILEKEGRLRQVGNRGKAVSYLKSQ